MTNENTTSTSTSTTTPKEYITIFAPGYARQLIKAGYTIADIKPNKQNPDATVFVFRNEHGLSEKVEEKVRLQREFDERMKKMI